MIKDISIVVVVVVVVVDDVGVNMSRNVPHHMSLGNHVLRHNLLSG